MVEKTINTDLARREITPLVGAVQGEKSARAIKINLYENGSAWTPPSGTAVIVRYRKPDGKAGNYDTLPDGSKAYTLEGSVCKIILAPQVCTVPGIVKLNVGLLNGDKEISTFSIDVDVQANPGVNAVSEDYVNIAGILPVTGWEPYKYLGTDANGTVVVREASTGPGVSSVKAVKTDNDITITQTLESGTVNTYTVTLVDGAPTRISGPNGSIDFEFVGWS